MEWTDGSTSVRGVRSLGDRFQGQVGARVLPHMARLQNALDTAADKHFDMSLGVISSTWDQSSVSVPIALDVGVFDWLTVGATMPWVRPEAELSLLFTADSGQANAGISPGVGSPALVSDFLRNLRGSIDRYDAFRASACRDDPGSRACVDATATSAETKSFHGALAAMYASLFTPLRSSPAARALEARLADFARVLQSAGIDGTPTSLPLADTTLNQETWAAILTDPAYGIGLSHPMESWIPQWRPGDLEVRLDTRVGEIHNDARRHHVTFGAGALIRLPTGSQDDPASLVDISSGDGQLDVELHAWLNGRWRDRYGLWADLRFGWQRGGITQRRVFDPSFLFAPASSERQLDWDPGDYGSIEVAPWFKLADPLAVLVGYRYWAKGEDSFSERALASPDSATVGTARSAPSTPQADPRVLVSGTKMSLGQFSLGMVYNRRAQAQGFSARPFEIRVVYRQITGGRGGGVPKSRSLEAGFRFYFSLWSPSP